MGGAEAAAAESVVTDQPDGVAVVNQRVVAGDLFVDRHQDLLLPDQLQQVTQLYALPLNHLPHRDGRGEFDGHIPFSVHRLQLSQQLDRHHVSRMLLPGGGVDSVRRAADNADAMPSLDVQQPGMPDLQFVLFVSALCTSDVQTINVPDPVRRAIFDRCWTLINAGPPPQDPKLRVLDLREGTELTLDACLTTIRSLLLETGITRLEWDNPVSEPSRDSTPAAKPLIERLGQLYPERPDIVDPPGDPPAADRR